MKSILVTGASGSVGGDVVALAEAAGYRVVASDLPGRGTRMPVRGEVRLGDIRDKAFCQSVVQGCDAIIHTAAQLDVAADSAELTHTNVDAVVSLYEAAAAAGAKRFVHVSTATLYAATGGLLDETTSLHPRGPYGMSKHAAELFLRAQHRGPSWTIIRPAPIYGMRGRHFAAVLLAIGPLLRMVGPVLPRFEGGPEGTMVHAHDVARALLFVLEREQTFGEVYNVSDGDVMTLGERIATTFDAYGLKMVPVARVSPAMLRLLGSALKLPGPYHAVDRLALGAWRFVVLRHGLKSALRPRMDREAMTLLYEDLVIDSGRLRRLGWEPTFPRFDAGFRQVLRWYQAEQWVPRYG